MSVKGPCNPLQQVHPRPKKCGIPHGRRQQHDQLVNAVNSKADPLHCGLEGCAENVQIEFELKEFAVVTAQFYTVCMLQLRGGGFVSPFAKGKVTKISTLFRSCLSGIHA